MSWTEPQCRCGGVSGWDGCQPAARAEPPVTPDLERFRQAIAADLAPTQLTTAMQPTEPQALPVAGQPIDRAFENWLMTLERPNA